MADIVTKEPCLAYKDDKLNAPSDKASFDSSSEKKGVDDAEVVREIEAFEERLQNDEATDAEYLIQDVADVDPKVLSTHDDPDSSLRHSELSSSGSDSWHSAPQIYYFKPQTLSVSQLFLLVLTYWLGNLMHLGLPSRDVFKWINTGPFNIKEHVAIIIMSSTAAGSATAIQVISVQDLYYNNKMNAGIAIFTLIGSQLLEYGFAGFSRTS